MTELELIETIIDYNESVPGWPGLYMTTLTGYLVVAYYVGKELTRSHMFIVSACFSIFAVLCAYSAVASSTRILEFTNEPRDMYYTNQESRSLSRARK